MFRLIAEHCSSLAESVSFFEPVLRCSHILEACVLTSLIDSILFVLISDTLRRSMQRRRDKVSIVKS